MKLSPDAEKSISLCILRLRVRNPFFATVALFARCEGSKQTPTAATDGQRLYVNEQWFMSITADERDGVFLHEVIHAAMLHVWRRGQRDPLIWNIAADISVNGMIASVQLRLPTGCIREPTLEHLSVEEIYDKLLDNATTITLTPAQQDLMPGRPDDAQNGNPQDGDGDGKEQDEKKSGNGYNGPGGAIEAHTRADASQYWKNAVEQAKTVAQGQQQGRMPAGMQREFNALNPSLMDWRSYLWRYLVQTPTDFGDYDRRHISEDLYLETTTGESVHVAVCVDTSGSIYGAVLDAFLAEVNGILNAYPHLRCDLYYCDAQLDGPHELQARSVIPVAKGGGGTSFEPFFDHIAEDEMTTNVKVLVYLTDGYGTFPDEAPKIPTLWVVTSGGLDLEEFPFGETVRLVGDHAA